jgi:hypothetical protein
VVPELERLELVGESNFAGLIAMAEAVLEYGGMTLRQRLLDSHPVLKPVPKYI